MKLLASIVVFVISLNSWAQEAYFTPLEIDVLEFLHVDSLGIREDIQSDSSVEITIYRKGVNTYMVKQEDEVFRAWPLPYNTQIEKLKAHDFNGGWPETVVYWEFINGHSGWGGGTSEQSGVVEIYDLESAKVLLSLDNYLRAETWSNHYLDTTSNTPRDKQTLTTSSTTHYCEEFNFAFDHSLIHITPIYDQKCNGVKPEEMLEPKALEWRGDAFYQSD